MISDSKKLIYLQKILKSREFIESKNYQELLRYLVENSMSGEPPKESSIALTVFGKNITDINNDTTVRVYIHNLQKKLDTYYMNEGKDNPVRLSIPKGHYLVQFLQEDKYNQVKKQKFFSWCLILAFFILFLLGILYWTSRNPYHSFRFPKNDPVWKECIRNDLPVLIVFGDYFVYRDTTQYPGRILYVRDVDINSNMDLDLAISLGLIKKGNIQKTDHTILGKCAPWSLYQLQPKFIANSKIPEIKLASSLQWEDLKKYNILFIGAFKTLGILKSAVNKLHFIYQNLPTPSTLIVKEDSTGLNNNVVLFFLSTHDIGQIATVRFFTDPVSLSNFSKQYLTKLSEGKTIRFFETIFEVTGFERTGFNTQMLHFFPIDEKHKIELP